MATSLATSLATSSVSGTTQNAQMTSITAGHHGGPYWTRTSDLSRVRRAL